MAAQMKTSKIQTFSRFSVLDIDSEEEQSKDQDLNEKNSKSIKNAKKKANKKKKKSSDAEVRFIIFNFPSFFLFFFAHLGFFFLLCLFE